MPPSSHKTLPPVAPKREPATVAVAIPGPPRTPTGTMPSPSRNEMIPPPSVSPQVDQAIGKLVRAAWSKLWPVILAGGLGSGGAVLARPTPPPERVDAQGQQLSEARQRVTELEETVSDLEGRDRARSRYDREQQSWLLGVLALQNVHVRRPEGLPAPTPIDTVSPLKRPKPKSMVVLDEPPALP